MYENRITHLEKQHETLDKQIDTMERTGHFGDMNLQFLKKKRLQIRDELADLRRRQHEHDQEVGNDE
jgi:hypothetical protein